MTVSLPPLIKPCMPFSSTRLSKFQVTGSPLHMRLGFLPRGVDWDFIEAIVSVQPFSAKEALFAPALAVFLPQPPLDAAMDFEPRSRHGPSAVTKAEVSLQPRNTRLASAMTVSVRRAWEYWWKSSRILWRRATRPA